MKYVNLNRKLMMPLILAALTSSCSLRSNGQSNTVRIPLPGAKVSWMEQLTDWLNVAWASSTTTVNLNSDPLGLSDFDCFAVNVTGPGINPDPRVTCDDPSTAPAVIGGFVPAGASSIDLVVPSGPSRTIKIFGSRSLVGCPALQDMLNDGAIKFDGNIGHMYDIGGATKDIFNDDSVTIKVAYDSANPKRMFSSCRTQGQSGGGTHLWNVFAGTGPGIVYSTKSVGSTTYIGGKFDYVGPSTMSGAIISQANGSFSLPNNAHIGGGTVNCAVRDGQGGFYVGGSFTTVESTTVQGLAHIRYDGTYDSTFNVGTNGIVYACETDGTSLYIGGSFTTVTNSGGPTSANHLAAINLTTQAVSTFTSAPSGTVYALAYNVSLNHLYAGGSFSTPSPNFVGYSAATRTTSIGITLASVAGGSVNAIAYRLGTIFIGGSFTTIGGVSSTYIGQINAVTGARVTWGPSTALSGPVTSIAVDGSYAYAAVSSSSPSVTKLDISVASPTPTNLLAGTTGESFNVLTLSSDNTQLYVGGVFVTGSDQQNLVSIQNPATGSPSINASFVANTNTGSGVWALATNLLGELFVGGNFYSIGGYPRQFVAAIDQSSGSATTWAPTGIYSAVKALETDGTSLYAGFTSDSGNLVPAGVAKLSLSGTGSLTWNKYTGSYAADTVNALALNGSSLYVGGAFGTIASGSSYTGIGALNTTTGAALTWKPTLGRTAGTPTVNSIVVNGSTVYIGGMFDTVGGTAAHALAGVDTTSATLSSTWTHDPQILYGGYGYKVNSIAFTGTELIVGGTWDHVGGGTYTNPIAAFDLTGAVMSWANAPSLASAMNAVNALEVSGNMLYIGGIAASISGSAAVAYDLSTQQTQSLWGANIGNYNNVFSIEATPTGLLILGGDFQQVNLGNPLAGGKFTPGIGAFDATSGLLY